MSSAKGGPTFSEFTRRTWVVIGSAFAVVVLALILLRLAQFVLLVFAGTLLAVLLLGLSRPLAKRMNVGETPALLIVVLLLVLVISASAVLLAPSVGEQVGELAVAVPDAWESAVDYLQSREWGAWLIDSAPDPGQLTEGGSIFTNFFGVFSTALGALANLFFVIILGIYLALNPRIYWRGAVLLIPISRRERATEIFHTMGDMLWEWLKGQFIMMVAVGVLTAVGLKIAGVPLALGLGVIAGLFEFVPILGPIVAAVPGLLIALAHGPMTALYALIVYVAVQQIEGNVLAPLVMREMVSLAPALTLSATIIAGMMFGVVGVLLATPLALLAVIFVRMVYVNDVLGDNVPPVPEYGQQSKIKKPSKGRS